MRMGGAEKIFFFFGHNRGVESPTIYSVASILYLWAELRILQLRLADDTPEMSESL